MKIYIEMIKLRFTWGTEVEMWRIDTYETITIDPLLQGVYQNFGIFQVDFGFCAKN